MAMIYSIHSASIRIINRCEMREWTINLKCAKKGVNCIMFKVIEQRWSASKVGILYSCASNMFKMRVEQAAINCASISAKKFDEMCWDWIGLDWMDQIEGQSPHPIIWVWKLRAPRGCRSRRALWPPSCISTRSECCSLARVLRADVCTQQRERYPRTPDARVIISNLWARGSGQSKLYAHAPHTCYHSFAVESYIRNTLPNNLCKRIETISQNTGEAMFDYRRRISLIASSKQQANSL